MKFNPNAVILFCSVDVLAGQFRCICLVKSVLGIDCKRKSSADFEWLLGMDKEFVASLL